MREFIQVMLIFVVLIGGGMGVFLLADQLTHGGITGLPIGSASINVTTLDFLECNLDPSVINLTISQGDSAVGLFGLFNNGTVNADVEMSSNDPPIFTSNSSNVTFNTTTSPTPPNATTVIGNTPDVNATALEIATDLDSNGSIDINFLFEVALDEPAGVKSRTWNFNCIQTGDGCFDDDDCDEGEECDNGTCVPEDECEDDDDCDDEEMCVSGECVPEEGECSDEDDCQYWEDCIDNECLKKCSHDWQCPHDEECDDGHCVPEDDDDDDD